MLFPAAASAKPGATVVNPHVTVRTEEGRRAVIVDGIVVHHYAVGDRMAEAYAMVLLVEQGYADQNDLARAFACATRTLRRYQDRFAVGGLAALGRVAGRPVGTYSDGRKDRQLDQTILRLKAEGLGKREVATKLHLDEKTVRRKLRRLGVQPAADPRILFPDGPRESSEEPASLPDSTGDGSVDLPLPASFDPDPFHRSIDRLLARLGVLEDAAPLFAPATDLPRAGILLAIPPFLQSGVLAVARDVYESIGPAFYGLRTTITACVLLALLRVKRPEGLKEHSPEALGRILGLDRVPEVKTLRRKLVAFASKGGAERFGRELARRRVAARGRAMGLLYVDGHVRVYHGMRTIPKAHVTQMRISLPATTDYWINDKRGDPLFVVTAQANAPLTKMLLPVLEEARTIVGPRRRITVVFDRGGFSPKLFKKVIAKGFDLLTYRKGPFPPIPQVRFQFLRARIDGHRVAYVLDDCRVRLARRSLTLRQVTRLTEDGHQTPILTNRLDLRAVEVAYRMFERWRQENFFKYMRDEFAIDALVDYAVEPDDPARSVPNPRWRRLDRQVRSGRAEVARLARAYGEAAMDNVESRRPTIRGFKIAHGKLGRQLRTARARVRRLEFRRAWTPDRVPVAEALQGSPVLKLATERKHFTNILKMVAYQVESDLLEMIRPHYARSDDEGRTLIQTALQSAATLDPASEELRVTLAPLSSPHRSRAVAALCETLNRMNTTFPGTRLHLRYAIAPAPGNPG